MHIHAGHLNLNASPAGPHASSSVLAARRAEETRKRLSAASSELDAASSSESDWMITAWAGGNAASNPDQSSRDQSSRNPSSSDSASLNLPAHDLRAHDLPESSTLSRDLGTQESDSSIESLRSIPAAGPVSYWA
jgi:hypothetical protein